VVDLVCYVFDGWSPLIRPASHRRDWMDGTPERFAYRCLPLAIANAHGWELLSPCGFEARWTGGPGTDAIEIRLDAGEASTRVPVSLFGQGTITFHVEGIFQTSPGWNLWVSGPPNISKDGIAPLSGVIETDWSPYSFTMNWQLTRTDQWVRFEKNEPICFFFPVQRQMLTEIKPKILPITDNSELKAAFEAWSTSRNAFHKLMKENPPTSPSEKWQKLYFRGEKPNGEVGPDDHVTKLRLPPFAGARVPKEAPRTPAVEHREKTDLAHPVSVADPKGDTLPLLSPERLRSALRQIGFAAEPVIQSMDTGDDQPSCPVHAKPAAPTAQETALARRDWLLETIERQRALSSKASYIPVVRDLSSDDFLDGFYAPGRPVVIEGTMANWPALSLWTPEYLRDAVGSAEIEFQGGRTSDPDFELYKDNHKQKMPFDRFIDLIDAGGNDSYITAYNGHMNKTALASLERDLGSLDSYLTRGAGMMWIGPAGTFTPLHFDLTNNLIAQIVGSKRVVLVPPSETSKLAHRRHVFSDVHDITDDARLKLFENAASACCIELDLKAGDLLYVPVGWWHQITAIEFSVSVTYTNFLWPNDAYRTFPED
jgi:hypothetical protein